jgi:uncharacterized SAM-binding protein YcdF (DUF218 family)
MKPKHPRRRAYVWGFLSGAAALALLLFVLNVTALPDLLVKPLQRPDTSGEADAIVVLGAGYWRPCGLTRSAWQRTLHGVRLWQEGRAARLVFTGGPTKESGGVAVAREMADLAVRLGVPRDAVLQEVVSRNTHENAVLAAALLRPLGYKRVLLVTDSIHMRRAEACFRSAGFEVERSSVHQVCVSSSNLAMLDSALHEYAGWWYYRRKGWVTPDGPVP